MDDTAYSTSGLGLLIKGNPNVSIPEDSLILPKHQTRETFSLKTVNRPSKSVTEFSSSDFHWLTKLLVPLPVLIHILIQYHNARHYAPALYYKWLAAIAEHGVLPQIRPSFPFGPPLQYSLASFRRPKACRHLAASSL